MSSVAVEETYALGDAPPMTTALVRRGPIEVSSVDEMRAVMALKDDEQILAAMAGAMIEEWTYTFKIGSDQIEGISAAGAVEIARLRGEDGFPIRFPVDQLWCEEVTQNGEPGLRVRIVARDVRTGADAVGMVFEPYYLTVNVKDKQGKKTGETRRIVNDFADRKALGKARRNAILDLVPEAQLKYLLANRKQILARNAEKAQAPRPVVSGRPEARRISAPESAAAQRPHPAVNAQAAATMTGNDASEEQISRLLDLADNATDAQREKIHKGLRRGIKAQVAQTWIEIMEREQGIAHATDDGELALDDKQPARNAVAEGH